MLLQKFFSTARKLQSHVREIKKSHVRSSLWPMVRDMHLKENPVCEACGSNKTLQVHHVLPFHLEPKLELEPENLVTLCMDEFDCHLSIGHGGSFQHYNPNVIEDCKKFMLAKINERSDILTTIKQNRLKD